MTLTEGGNLTLSCNATGNPVPTISWTRDGSPVDTSGRISFSENKKELTITDVSRTDSGEYRCVATNRVGNDTSNAATLNVQCKLLSYSNLVQPNSSNTVAPPKTHSEWFNVSIIIFCMVYKTIPQNTQLEALK